ncbi:MAG: di-heme oxidoredictase family protein [Pseudomonadota bacterium]
MKQISSALLLLMAGPVMGQDLADVHLNVVPRTAEESARVARVTAPQVTFNAPVQFEAMPAGTATVAARRGEDAFSQHTRTLKGDEGLDFAVGRGLFRKLWVSSPSSTLASDGLGPLFNARSCVRCHVNNGRGHPPEGPADNATSMLLRVTIPTDDADMTRAIEGYLATAPDPTYGGQLQDFALPGHPAEAELSVTYTDVPVTLSDGTVITLRQPSYSASKLGYGPLHPDAMLSPRVAPQMIGLGLLEAVPAADILANADPDDADGDGISGRPNVVWSVEFNRPMLGRFGLKAGMPTLREQSAAAFAGDIGISNPVFPDPHGDCTTEQKSCINAPHGDGDAREFEIGRIGLDLVTFYSANLAVPQRRKIDDPTVLRGKEVFYTAGCISCHQPSFVTHRLKDRPEHSFQLIWPYTDLLLHDMGPALADNSPEAVANGREWRTPPLWGIGLTRQVSGHTYFLHDGRARSLLEAILWHGGEAEAHKQKVIAMPKADRDAMITFLESL